MINRYNTISWKTLQKLRDFYESGGTIVSTTILPSKSSEMGEDQKVIDLVQGIFEINSLTQNTTQVQNNSNEKGGKAIFIPSPGKANIQEVLNTILPDVQFETNPTLFTDFGKFSYIHKVNAGRNIYYTNLIYKCRIAATQ